MVESETGDRYQHNGQRFELIPNDYGIIQVRFYGPDGQSEKVLLEDLPTGQPVEVEIIAGTANPIEGGHP